MCAGCNWVWFCDDIPGQGNAEGCSVMASGPQLQHRPSASNSAAGRQQQYATGTCSCVRAAAQSLTVSSRVATTSGAQCRACARLAANALQSRQQCCARGCCAVLHAWTACRGTGLLHRPQQRCATGHTYHQHAFGVHEEGWGVVCMRVGGEGRGHQHGSPQAGGGWEFTLQGRGGS